MNYRHLYHAGSFADVVKHIILTAILEEMQKKDSPYTVIDAFGGLGLYDLASVEASKTLEHVNGIGQLLATQHQQLPAVVANYLNIIKRFPSHIYPGSPTIISSLLRENDKLIVTELHPQDYAILKHNMRKCDNTAVHLMDGYNGIKAFLPPKNPRGLVFLDPAFEVKNEFSKLVDLLKLIRKRFFAGIVMIWYPVKNNIETQEFYQLVKTTGYPEFVKIEFGLQEKSIKMTKCGILIANPPNMIPRIRELLEFLSNNVYAGRAEFEVEIL